jgi:hypothetical protein
MTPDFQHHGAERIAGERIRRRPQRAVGVGSAHRDQMARVEAELAKPAHRQGACLAFGKILPYPDQRPPRRNACAQGSDKAGRGRTLPAGFRKHLMHRTDREATGKRRVDVRMAERHPARRARTAKGIDTRLDAFDPPAQSRKRAHACARHAPRPQILIWPSRVNL